ncbi:MAG: hypothetical protein CVV47_05015 [Spirochaetae bacterium HGW-Spirochaetae-3]|jgi:PAS domain S-box-containing protein|nr:MAG: hypothetical protein CVV47_05015 [Spirochaetae bacterium HGW-Spirochaetae-3]
MNEQTVTPSRIAICEDERIVALDIRAFLQRNGYEVPAIYAAAEDLLRDAEEIKPDLVLMDIHLQGEMDGIEASAELLQRWSIPVILLTAYADGPTIERAKLTHPYAYILKPYDERELKTAISIGLYRASMEQRLRSSEERYRGLFENGLAASMLVELGGRILETNKAYRTLAPEAESVREFIDDEVVYGEVMRAMASGESYGPNEIEVRRTDGKEAWALLSAAPIVLPDGGRAYQYQAVDVTERKTLMDQLIHAQRLSALGRFAGGVAHDFNNVLTAVMGYARLLRSDFEVEGRGLEELDGIDQAAKRAAALSRQLLMFSRRDESKATAFRLSNLARENERILKRIVGDGFSIIVRAFDGNDTVVVDKGRLEQAIVNLVANARDAMPSGGRIVLATGVQHTQAETPGAIEPVPAGDWAYIEIQDEGTGIPKATQAKIFQPFFTTKPADRGTGLGLATVVGIVRQAGGRITMNSALGKGTTMRLLFPRASERLLESAGDAEASIAKPYGKPVRCQDKTVLLVENDNSVLTIAEALLDRAGYRVVTANHPGEALLVVEKMAAAPDVVVVNDKMPLMSGFELVERFRAREPMLPALFLLNAETIDGDSASADDGQAAYRMPREARLRKPFSEEDLLEAIAALLGP